MHNKMTSQEHIATAYVTLGDNKVELALFNATMAIAIGQGEFIAAIEAMRNQGPPQVGGVRKMVCGSTIGDNACRGAIQDHIYNVIHNDGNNSSYGYQCCNCGKYTRVSRVATASLPPELQPVAVVAIAS
jgi:hypothetical protein